MIGADVAATLPDLRAQAESRMTETVRIGREVDGFDPLTGDASVELDPIRYVGKGRVRFPSYAVEQASPVSQPVASQIVVVSIPVGVATVYKGDVVEVTASTADGGVIGRRFTVTGQPLVGQVTAYRIPVKERS